MLGLSLLTLFVLRPFSTHALDRAYDARSFSGAHVAQQDVWLNAWILEWGRHALGSGRLRGFFDANIFHPEPRTLAYSEHLLGVAPFYAVARLFADDAVAATNLWVLASSVLCGAAMYAVALAWLRSPAAALFAALAFAFAPWRFGSLKHVQALAVMYLPAIAWLVWETRRRRSLRLWLALAGVMALQALCSFYLGYLAFVCAGVLLLASLPGVDEPVAARLVFGASALAAAALLLLPVSLPYAALAAAGGLAPAAPVVVPWRLLAEYLYPSPASWRAWHALPALAALGFALGVRRPEQRALALALAALAASTALLAMGPSLVVAGLPLGAPSAWLGGWLPGWASLRVSSRFGIGTWFALCALAALPFASAQGRSPRARRALGAAALVCAGALVLSSSGVELRTRPSPLRERDPAPYRWLAAHGAGDPLLEWPMRFGNDDAQAELLSTLHWLPLLNGYSGYRPPSNELVGALADQLPEPAALATLRRLGLARWLLVDETRRDQGLRDFSQLAPAGARLRLAFAGGALYELERAGAPPPELTRRGPPPAATLLGTPLASLRARELAADLTPELARLETDGRRRWLVLRVVNHSATRWPAVAVDRDGLVGLAFRRRRAGADTWEGHPGFTRLPADLAPGEATRLHVRVEAPPAAGEYELLPCLQQWGRAVVSCAARSTLSLHRTAPTD